MKKRKGGGIDVLILVAVVMIVASVAVASPFTLARVFERASVSEKAKASLLAVRVAGDLVEMYADEHLVFPGPTNGLVPLASLRQTLAVSAPRYFPQHDAWGHGLLYWSNGLDYMILSEGSDGRPDYSYDQHEIPYDGITPGVNASDTQDIILVHDIVLRGPFGSRNSRRTTMTDMRAIGTACEQYAIDNNFYPNFAATLIPVFDLAPHLTPVYIRNLPQTDAWIQPYLYWSNGATYLIISNTEQAPQRGREGGPTGRRDRPRRPVGAHPGRRARAAQSAPGGRSRGRAEADGHQAAAREGLQDHAGQRDAVLAPVEEALSVGCRGSQDRNLLTRLALQA